MENFDVFRLNGIENYPVSGEKFLKMLFLRSHKHTFPRIYTTRGHTFFKGGGGQCPPRGGGGQ